jgi:translocation protein SEC63
LSGLVTLPLTYNLLRPSKGEFWEPIISAFNRRTPTKIYRLQDLENTAPRIKSNFKPQHADLVEAQKRKRLRKERRIKRIITVILGYLVMAWMVYLILVTARTTAKVYDPYDILGVSRVCFVAPRRTCRERSP